MSYHKETMNFLDDIESGLISHFPLVKSPNTDVLSKLGKCIPLGKSLYMAVGGNSGSGKTAIVDSEFVIKVYFWWKRNRDNLSIKPFWIYRSMERPTKFKIAKWICLLIYIEHNIVIDVPTFFGFPNKIRELSAEEKKLTRSYEKWFEHEFEKHIIIFSGAENPTGIRNTLLKFYRNRGKEYFAGENYISLNGNKVKSFTKVHRDPETKLYFEVLDGEKIFQYDHKYIPDDKELLVIQITDHINALKSERGLNDKGLIDKHSEYCREFRDIFETFVINISQFNRGQEDSTRKYKGELDVLESDFKGSSSTYEDADIVLGMINPYKSGETRRYRGYDINKSVHNGYNRFRMLKLLKNSYGVDDIRIGYGFLGEMGLMMELPKASEMTDYHYDALKNSQFFNL
jgi:hypothetical protein